MENYTVNPSKILLPVPFASVRSSILMVFTYGVLRKNILPCVGILMQSLETTIFKLTK